MNPAFVAVPTGVVTATSPVVPEATTAVMLVAETTLNEAASVPPKLTAVAPTKLVPVIVMVEPAPPVDVKDEIVGEGTKVNPALAAVPPGVVTDILPEAPAPTTAVMLVDETTEKDAAAVPPKLTAVLPVKLVPSIVIVAPLAELVGVKDEIVGEIAKTNPGFVAVPPGVVTATSPEVPNATTAVILVAETTLNEVAAVPPKLTAVAPVKPVPVIVMVEPVPPAGVKERIVGAGININPVFVAVPSGVVTDTLPDAPSATTAVMLVAETTLNEAAAVPPKLTAVVPEKFVPLIVMVATAAPLVGVNNEIVGTRTNVNPALDAIPLGVVTETSPDAPLPTMAVILVADTTLNEAATVPPKLTSVAPIKPVPEIVMILPFPPLGVKEAIVGAAINVNPVFIAVPPGVITETLPDVPAATTALILVAETTLNDVAAVPPKLTAVAPLRLVPVMVTVAAETALVGVNESIVGKETVTTEDGFPEAILVL